MYPCCFILTTWLVVYYLFSTKVVRQKDLMFSANVVAWVSCFHASNYFEKGCPLCVAKYWRKMLTFCMCFVVIQDGMACITNAETRHILEQRSKWNGCSKHNFKRNSMDKHFHKFTPICFRRWLISFLWENCSLYHEQLISCHLSPKLWAYPQWFTADLLSYAAY